MDCSPKELDMNNDYVIVFTKPWWKQEPKKFEILTQKHRKKLPSTSQWYRFRQKVLTARKISDIRWFLEERPLKSKTAPQWTFRFENSPFCNFITDKFIRVPEGAKGVAELKGSNYFGLSLTGKINSGNDEMEQVKLKIVQKALVEFIDRILIFKEGMDFREKENNDGIRKLEVKHVG